MFVDISQLNPTQRKAKEFLKNNSIESYQTYYQHYTNINIDKKENKSAYSSNKERTLNRKGSRYFFQANAWIN